MRRTVCWLIIFVIGASFFPVPAGAVDDPNLQVAPETSGQSSGDLTPKADESLPQSETVTELSTAPLSVAPLEAPPAQVISSPVLVSNPVAPAVTSPETTPDSIITTFNVSSTIEYVELYNQSDQPVDISAMVFKASTPSGETCDLKLAGNSWLLPDEYLTVSSPTTAATSPYVFSGDCLFSSDITRLEVYYRNIRIQIIDGITASGASWFRHAGNVKSNTKTSLDCTHKTLPSTMKQTGSSNDYVRCGGTADLVGDSLYVPPAANNGLKIVELFPNSRSCVPSETALDCSDYIKVKNTSASEVNLAEFRVRSGAKYSNATASTSFNWHQPTLNPARDELILEPGQYFLLRLRNDGQVLGLSNAEGNVWIEDYYGVQSYEEASYNGMDLAAAGGKSWAYDETNQTWRFGVPAPYGDNAYPEEEPGKGSASSSSSSLKPCRDDQYRSEETNRCRNITSAGGLTPCKEGQYRSEETNRCRSIASAAAAVLKPCADDQFRNPETNRCKKIASSDDAALADCGEGRERNPETNRCRNVASSKVPDAAFAVEPVKDAGKAFVGWWALGGVSALALGYGAWEWRHEMLAGIRKVGSFFISSK